MGFSIGRFLKAVAPTAIGAIIGGPVGAGVGAQLTRGFAAAGSQASSVAPQQSLPGRQLAPQSFAARSPFLPSVSTVPSAFNLASLPPILGRAAPLAPIPFMGLFGGNGQKNRISQILAQAREATGGSVTRNKIIDAAKTCGIDQAASTFGISTDDVCFVVVQGRTRRRRGISAADLRRTRSTIRKVNTISRDLRALAPSRAVARRK